MKLYVRERQEKQREINEKSGGKKEEEDTKKSPEIGKTQEIQAH